MKPSALFLFLLGIIPLSLFAQPSTGISYTDYVIERKDGQQVETQLGKFFVPQNHFAEETSQIKLAFLRFSSPNPNQDFPIVYLAGGPGGSGINAAKFRRHPLFTALQSLSDVIAFDQRGTGLSHPFPDCSESMEIPFDQPFDPDAYIQQLAQKLPSCIAEWQAAGWNFAAYNTRQSVEDLEALRKALGVEKLNLWGISYGTHLGMAYMKYYPERVNRVVFAGLEGLDQTVKEPRHIDAYLERINQFVQADSFYRDKIPDLKQLMQSVYDQLAASPQVIQTYIPNTYTEITLGIGKADIQLLTHYLLIKNPRQLQLLPALFLAMQAGEYSKVAPYVMGVKRYFTQINGMALAMDAMSGITPAKLAAVQAQLEASSLSALHSFPFPHVWEAYSFERLEESFRVPPQFTPKALLLSGELDGRTPLESTAEVRSQFANAHPILVKDAGHDLFMSSPDLITLIADFFAGKAIERDTLQASKAFSFVK